VNSLPKSVQHANDSATEPPKLDSTVQISPRICLPVRLCVHCAWRQNREESANESAITNNYAGENCCRTHAPRQRPPRVGTGVLTNGVPMRRRKRRVFSRFNGPIRTRTSISTDARLDRCKISMKNTSRHRTSDFS